MATNAPLKTDIKQHLHGKVNKGPKSSHFILKRAERMRIVLYSLFQIYSPNFIPLICSSNYLYIDGFTQRNIKYIHCLMELATRI